MVVDVSVNELNRKNYYLCSWIGIQTMPNFI